MVTKMPESQFGKELERKISEYVYLGNCLDPTSQDHARIVGNNELKETRNKYLDTCIWLRRNGLTVDLTLDEYKKLVQSPDGTIAGYIDSITNKGIEVLNACTKKGEKHYFKGNEENIEYCLTIEGTDKKYPDIYLRIKDTKTFEQRKKSMKDPKPKSQNSTEPFLRQLIDNMKHGNIFITRIVEETDNDAYKITAKNSIGEVAYGRIKFAQAELEEFGNNKVDYIELQGLRYTSKDYEALPNSETETECIQSFYDVLINGKMI